MKRRSFLQQSALATGSLLLSKYSFSTNKNYPVVRVAAGDRKFTSTAIEKVIRDVKKNISNKEIGWLFENCFPNTLDTTVDFTTVNVKPDTYVITGDIDAMWLRDRTAQVWPYLPFCKEDKNLQLLIAGVIRRQTQCILLDPYANAFYKDFTKKSEWKDDLTAMKPGIHERKWEIDSLCYPIRLSYGYWKATGDTSPFDNDWKQAMTVVIAIFIEQQRLNNNGRYHFQRKTAWATDGVPMAGYGYPTKKIGLIHSMFRPSDDATIYPFLIPSNLFAAESIFQLLQMANNDLPAETVSLAAQMLNTILKGVSQYGVVNHPSFGKIYAYETNGFSSYNLMDDANVPSLFSLPYLISSGVGGNLENGLYRNTRKFVLSAENPFFFKGRAGEGIGGPHVGMDYIWPMSIIMRALTSLDDKEIKYCLDMLQNSNAGTGFMHESFHKDDATKFTRKWFAWANTLFGELVLKTYREKRSLLQ
jgi:meiotically up-regulated gene 157 (Mug157) protein